MKAEIVNLSGENINISFLRRWIRDIGLELNRQNLLSKHTESYLTLAFVSEDYILKLNSQLRKQKSATNILSFPHHNEKPADQNNRKGPVFLGELALCLSVINKESQNFQFAYWLYYLILHGVLHLLGFEHTETSPQQVPEKTDTLSPPEEELMYRVQDQIFEKLKKNFQLPKKSK